MAMTFEESNAMMQDQAFIGKVKVSVINYSTYIINEAPSTPGHAPRYRWAQAAMRDPDMNARSLVPSVVMDGEIQTAGAAAADNVIQSAVERVVNRFM